MVQKDFEKLFMNLLQLAPRLASHFATLQEITMGHQLRMDRSPKLSSIHRMNNETCSKDFRNGPFSFWLPKKSYKCPRKGAFFARKWSEQALPVFIGGL